MPRFKFTETNGGTFHIGHENIYTDGVEFSIKNAQVGRWTADGQPLNYQGDDARSIRLVTSLSTDSQDALNLRLFMGRSRTYLDDNHKLKSVKRCSFWNELCEFIRKEIGVKDDVCEGTADDVANKIVKDFFGNKTIVVKTIEGFTTDENGNVVPTSFPTFHWKK